MDSKQAHEVTVGEWAFVEPDPSRNLWLSGQCKVISVLANSAIVGEYLVIFDLYLEGDENTGTQDTVIQSVYPLDAMFFYGDSFTKRLDTRYAHMAQLPRERR
jgi:hypothetical protein